MKLLDLMQKCMDEKRSMIIHDGYNNLYRLEYKSGKYPDVVMYEHSPTVLLVITVDVTYDILSNEYYEEL